MADMDVASNVSDYDGGYNDVTASRDRGVWYQNTSGSDLVVVAVFGCNQTTSANGRFFISPDGSFGNSSYIDSTRISGSEVFSSSDNIVLSATIPDGDYYWIDVGPPDSWSIEKWRERT